jgi:hypothetical protein
MKIAIWSLNKMPQYILPKDLDTKPANTGVADANAGLSKGTETLKLVNDLLTNGNKFLDGLTMILNKKKDEGNIQLSEEQINAKAHKIAQEQLNNQKAQYSQEEMILTPQAPKQAPAPQIITIEKKYKVKVKEGSTQGLKDMLLLLDQDKTIGNYIKYDLAEIEKEGFLFPAVEQWIIKNTEIVEDK